MTGQCTGPASFVILLLFVLVACCSYVQVMDIGVNRKVANLVPSYLRRVADEGGNARFDTVPNTERAINMRFKYASRRLRVPYVYPGYFVTESVKQATLTGSEHRRALPFLPFAIIGVAGPPDDGEEHRALALCICELVSLTNALFNARRDGRGISFSEAAVLGRKAHEWVVDMFQSVLGPKHNTKLHRLSAHLLDEFRLRGNLSDGNCALNESLHKAVKAAYKNTNKRREQFIEQLIVNEQVHTMLQSDTGGSEASEDNNSRSDAAAAHTRRLQRRGSGRRRRRYSKQQSVTRMAQSRDLPGLADALGCDRDALLLPRPTMYYGDSSLRGRGRYQYTVRASPQFHGSPWMDWLRYRGQDGQLRVGQAALVVGNRTGTWERLVVRRAVSAPSQPDCVLTKYGCERLRWDVSPGGDCALLDVLRAEDIVRWLAVEYDWEDLSKRHGIMLMPDEVPKTAEELLATRFFVNSFARDGAGAVTYENDSDEEV